MSDILNRITLQTNEWKKQQQHVTLEVENRKRRELLSSVFISALAEASELNNSDTSQMGYTAFLINRTPKVLSYAFVISLYDIFLR